RRLTMTFEQVKSAVLNLDQSEQKRMILEVLTELLPEVCKDEECLNQIRNFVNEETIRTYREQHMGGI
ncbi:MAG: hypothetical protein WBB23_09880, partial [Desulforhopalus sp.]